MARCTKEVASYNYLAGLHEHDVSKYLNLLGTGIPGVVCHEDRIAFNYLRSRPDVLNGTSVTTSPRSARQPPIAPGPSVDFRP